MVHEKVINDEEKLWENWTCAELLVNFVIGHSVSISASDHALNLYFCLEVTLCQCNRYPTTYVCRSTFGNVEVF